MQPVIRPKVSDNLDWEGELAVIIGKAGRHIAEADAWKHVAGYSIYNDVSVREWQFHAKQIASGKNFVGTGPFGPWLVTPDEIGDPAKLKLETRVNGEVMQSSDTAMLIFSIPRLIEYSSTIFDLVPGDVIVTGTPAGVGWTRKPPTSSSPATWSRSRSRTSVCCAIPSSTSEVQARLTPRLNLRARNVKHY